MCRFIAYRGQPVTLHDVLFRPSHSIIVQSYRSLERPEPHNADGFGLAWYDPALQEEPGIFRSIRPAWSNRNLRSLSRMIRTRHFFAHVRAASGDLEVTELNCHPFSYGRFLFMHNGYLAHIGPIRLHLRKMLTDDAYLAIRGTSDSELLFGLFLDHWLRDGSPQDSAGMKRNFVAMIHSVIDLLGELGIAEASLLNMAVTDGDSIVVSRLATGDEAPPSLYISSGADYIEKEGAFHLVPVEGRRGSVFIASERFSGDTTWKPIPPNHLVSVWPDLEVEMEPVRSP